MGLSLVLVPALCLAGIAEATSQARMAAKVNPLLTLRAFPAVPWMNKRPSGSRYN